MNAIVRFIKFLFAKGDVGEKKVRIEGKQTREAKGRTLRLRAERERKEKHSRTGNRGTF